MNVSVSRLRELFSYDPTTGLFTRRVTSGGQPTGTIAGTTNLHGYIAIRVDGVIHLAHRLAWLYVYGSWPKHLIDHVNMVRTDNRIANLREANSHQNNTHKSIQANNTTGLRGVIRRPKGRWQARIKVNRRFITLGTFGTAEEAAEAYRKASLEFHGEFGSAAHE